MKPLIYIHHGLPIEIPAEYHDLLKSKYRKELAAEYGLDEQTFRRRIKKLKIDTGPRGYMDIPHVLNVYLTLGWPLKQR